MREAGSEEALTLPNRLQGLSLIVHTPTFHTSKKISIRP